MSAILQVKGLTKTYKSGNKDLTVLQEVTFDIIAGETVSIVGPSGSGKTTLLGLCAGLDQPSTGFVNLCGRLINDLSEDERATVRNEFVGFIFQDFQLITTLTAVENVSIPMELQGLRNVRETALRLLQRVGLADRAHHYPSELSGGEQQRVSIARAFSGSPKILFADEPTGNLDEETSLQIEKLLFDVNREMDTTLVIVTHDLELAKRTGRIIKLKGGHVISDIENLKASTLTQ